MPSLRKKTHQIMRYESSNLVPEMDPVMTLSMSMVDFFNPSYRHHSYNNTYQVWLNKTSSNLELLRPKFQYQKLNEDVINGGGQYCIISKLLYSTHHISNLRSVSQFRSEIANFRSSHRGFSLKNAFLETCKIHWKTSMLEPLF